MSDNKEEEYFYPTGYGIKIKLDKVEKMTKGGIYLSEGSLEGARYNMSKGTVVAMGDTCYTDPMFKGAVWCKLGDRVRVPSNLGYTFREDGHDYKFLNDLDIRMVGTKVKREEVFSNE